MKPDESFFEKVYEVVRKVPEGKVTTYGAVAAFLGTRMSARMVGWAMNKCHVHPYPVPAHRVVNRNGLLTGKHHFGGPDIMQQLLESEGVKIENNAIVDFKKHYWDPSDELPLNKL
jgi:methylated-DNA-protein-cysteine methyltransferase related protein